MADRGHGFRFVEEDGWWDGRRRGPATDVACAWEVMDQCAVAERAGAIQSAEACREGARHFHIGAGGGRGGPFHADPEAGSYGVGVLLSQAQCARRA